MGECGKIKGSDHNKSRASPERSSMAVTIELNTLNVSRVSIFSNTSPGATGGGVPAKGKSAKTGGGEGDLLEDVRRANYLLVRITFPSAK